MIEIIIGYFLSDPLKILYLFGGAGGVWFWFDKWTNRIRLEFTVTGETYRTNRPDDGVHMTITFGCRNLGRQKTSLKPQLEIETYLENGKCKKFLLPIRDGDLELPPHEMKKLGAVGDLPAVYVFSLYRAYRLRPTVGSGKRVFTHRSHRDVCSRWMRDWGAFKLKYFGVNPRITNRSTATPEDGAR